MSTHATQQNSGQARQGLAYQVGKALRAAGMTDHISVEQDRSDTGNLMLRIHRRPLSGVVIILNEDEANGRVAGHVIGMPDVGSLEEGACVTTAAQWAASACAALTEPLVPNVSPFGRS